MNKYQISIDYSRDGLFDELGKKRLKDSYMMAGENSPQERFAFVSSSFASNQEHAQRLYEYSSKHWLSFSTPILAFGRNKNGLPISCYLNYLDDTAEGLVNNLSETNWLSMMGGGVGVHVGIRGADSKSVGIMPHLKTYDASSLAFKQGSTRRGSYAAYLDISHPDVLQFLEMRKPTGDQNLRTLNLNHGINITDKFMEIIQECMVNPSADDTWELIQPNTGLVVDTVSAKALWMKIIELRMQTGEPYVWFIDHANKGLPEYQKQLGLKNHGSNLCVAPETFILTDNDYQQISELENKTVNVWNGKEFSPVVVRKTGENQKLIKVTTKYGPDLDFLTQSLECTPYHKFYVKIKDFIVEKRAHELNPGDNLIDIILPTGEHYEVIVTDVVDEGRIDDTFCFTELKRGMGVFNGILTGQCSEISLATDKNRTAVCCLSSVNLEYFDEWKQDPLFLRDILEMLDNVMTYFVEHAPDQIQRAKYSAMRERSVGVGALGYHAYLQQKNIPFESVIAKITNKNIFAHIRGGLDKANLELAQERGSCPDAAEMNVVKRCSHVMAIAPNACQSKDNIIRTVRGPKSMATILSEHCLNCSDIESSGVKKWVTLDSKFAVPTLIGEKDVSEVWYNGLEEVIEIEFEDGNKYKFTENHLLLVRTNDDTTMWVRVGDLTGDEEIVNI